MKSRIVFLLSGWLLAGAWPAAAADTKTGVAATPPNPVALDKQTVVFAAEAHAGAAAGVTPASKQLLAAVISVDFRSEPNPAKANQLLEKHAAEAAQRIDEARHATRWTIAVRQGPRMGTYDFDKSGFRTGLDAESRMLFYPVAGAANITYGVRFLEIAPFEIVPVPLEEKDKFSALIEKQKAHLFLEVEGVVGSVRLESRLNKLSPGTPTKVLGLTVQKVTLKFDDGTVIGSVSAPPGS